MVTMDQYIHVVHCYMYQSGNKYLLVYFFLSLSQPVVQVFFTGQKNHFIIIQLCAVAWTINHFLNMMIQNSSYIVLHWGGEVGSKTLAVSS